MSATNNLGAHLLGRRVVPDARDWRLEDFIAATPDPLDLLLPDLMNSREGRKTKAILKELTARVQSAIPPLVPAPSPPPSPQPTPTADVIWRNPEQTLDQGQTPHCVGFGWCQWGNDEGADGKDDGYRNADGHTVYYECKAIDGDPTGEDGTSVRSGAQSMQRRGRLANYAFTYQAPSVLTWLNTKGPVVIGSDWTDDMFVPDARGYVKPTGNVAGGHCYILVGNLKTEGAVLALNSWGASWGPLNGYFKISHDDLTKILTMNGEACAAVELP